MYVTILSLNSYSLSIFFKYSSNLNIFKNLNTIVLCAFSKSHGDVCWISLTILRYPSTTNNIIEMQSDLATYKAAHIRPSGPGMPRTPVAPATIRVVVTRSRAFVRGCPDLRSDTSPDLEGKTSSGYGCAVNRNLAAMVANPTDLVRGVDGPTTSDPATASRAINALRAAPPTGGGGTRLLDPNSKSSGGGGAGGRTSKLSSASDGTDSTGAKPSPTTRA